jgi:hypothetical protein
LARTCRSITTPLVATDSPHPSTGSSSLHTTTPPPACLWRWRCEERVNARRLAAGFPSTARLVMLPGLSNAALLSLLAKQAPDLIYTEPFRNLLSGMQRSNPVARPPLRLLLASLPHYACFVSRRVCLGLLTGCGCMSGVVSVGPGLRRAAWQPCDTAASRHASTRSSSSF